MKSFKLSECSLISNLRENMKEEYAMIIPEQLVPELYRVFMKSFAMMPKYHATKSNPKTGFAFRDDKGTFIMGSVLTYNAPETDGEESDDSGNYNLTFTFEEKDMTGMDVELDTFADSFLSIVQSAMFAEMHMHCDSNRDLIIIIAKFIGAIKSFLDANSNESKEEVQLEQPSVFVAAVSIDDAGEKHYTIVPGYSVKQVVKNDDENEKSDLKVVKGGKDDKTSKKETVSENVIAAAAFAPEFFAIRDNFVAVNAAYRFYGEQVGNEFMEARMYGSMMQSIFSPRV